jgi:hypothetical protein
MRKQMREGSSRRAFLSTASSLASLAAGMAAPALGAKGANDRIGIGLIGVGGRSTYHLESILASGSAQNVRITAVCDVWRKAD